MSRIYLQVLEVNSLEGTYRPAYWRDFTPGTETPPNASGGVFIGGIEPPPSLFVKIVFNTLTGEAILAIVTEWAILLSP